MTHQSPPVCLVVVPTRAIYLGQRHTGRPAPRICQSSAKCTSRWGVIGGQSTARAASVMLTRGAGTTDWMDQRGLFSRRGGSFWQFVLVLVGFLLMVIAIVPGAQFWFGLLSKIGAIRSTGPKPAAAS
jgi:hypothetical protein